MNKVRLENGNLYFNDTEIEINPNYHEAVCRRRDGWADSYSMSLILLYRNDLDFKEMSNNIRSHLPGDYNGLEISLTNHVGLEVMF